MAKITKAVAVGWLADAPQEKQFWCSDGRFLKNLPELAEALAEMSDETFFYHSNDSKSDFSKWVGDVIGDEELSGDLKKNRNRVKAAKAVADRVRWLRNK